MGAAMGMLLPHRLRTRSEDGASNAFAYLSLQETRCYAHDDKARAQLQMGKQARHYMHLGVPWQGWGGAAAQ